MNRRSERGYTVLEMVVSLALVSVILLGAAQLIAESVELMNRTGHALRSPPLTQATVRIRRDVQDGAALGMLTLSWTQEPLVLFTWDGRRIRYRSDGEQLVRETLNLLGQPTSTRVIARGMTSWWWRSVGPQIVDVRLTVLARPGASTSDRRTELRRFALRGWPGGRSW